MLGIMQNSGPCIGSPGENTATSSSPMEVQRPGERRMETLALRNAPDGPSEKLEPAATEGTLAVWLCRADSPRGAGLASAAGGNTNQWRLAALAARGGRRLEAGAAGLTNDDRGGSQREPGALVPREQSMDFCCLKHVPGHHARLARANETPAHAPERAVGLPSSATRPAEVGLFAATPLRAA